LLRVHKQNLSSSGLLVFCLFVLFIVLNQWHINEQLHSIIRSHSCITNNIITRVWNIHLMPQ